MDALNRDALYELVRRIGINNTQLPPLVQAAAPELSDKDKQAIENLELLVNFTLGNLKLQEMVDDLVKDPRGQGVTLARCVCVCVYVHLRIGKPQK